jgi:hypothetical protein
MKFSFSTLTLIICSFLFVLACTVDDQDSVVQEVVQTPVSEPEPAPEPEPEPAPEPENDSDGDGVVDSADYWPLDPTMSQNLWGIINDSPAEFFFASDISENIQNATRASFLEAIDEFGNWGPTELWVSGASFEGIEELANLYCTRRTERGQANFYSGQYPYTFESCKQLNLYPQLGSDLLDPQFNLNDQEGEGLEYYRGMSALTIENGYPTGYGKSLNGKRDWGFKIFNFSLPVGFSEPGYYYDYEKVNVFYEYFHALQESAFTDEQLGNTNEFGEDTRRGPHWFYAGASTYMAEYAVRKRNPDHSLNSFKDRMEQQFGYTSSEIEQNGCQGLALREIVPENSCFLIRFYWGMPAIGYLLNKVDNQNAIVETFYPNLYELGFQDAFELTFGLTVDAFYTEWETYMGLSMEDRLSILPDL